MANLIEQIVNGQGADATSEIKRKLGQKLKSALTEQRIQTAKETYGDLDEKSLFTTSRGPWIRHGATPERLEAERVKHEGRLKAAQAAHASAPKEEKWKHADEIRGAQHALKRINAQAKK